MHVFLSILRFTLLAALHAMQELGAQPDPQAHDWVLHHSGSLPHCSQLPYVVLWCSGHSFSCQVAVPSSSVRCAVADSFHKPGFKLHVKILHHLFTIVNSGVIKAPLWDETAKGPNAYPNNAVFVHEFVSDLLSRSFPNLRPAQLQVLLQPVSICFCAMLFCLSQHCRPCCLTQPCLQCLLCRIY